MMEEAGKIAVPIEEVRASLKITFAYQSTVLARTLY